jgi:hypothetical protein
VPVWLPNALVDGAADEVPPIELVRQTRSLPTLRLLVELYEVQFLPIFGGIPRDLLCVEFDRLRVGERGPFMVWGFSKKRRVASYNLTRPFFTGRFVTRDDGTRLDEGWDASFWPAVETLTTLGLIVPVGMLLDGDDPEAEIIHPYGVNGGEPAERELAHVAHEYGTPAALRDDVTAHYAPFPAIASVRFLDIVTFRGLPTYRVTLADGEGATTTAYYLVRRLGDGSLRIAGCVLVRVPST